MEDQKTATSNYLTTINRVVLKRLWLIILITFTVSISAFITSKIIEPVYEASTSIRVQITQQPASVKQHYTQPSLEPEAMWLKSRYLVELVMKNLGIGSTAKDQEEYIELMEKLQNNINVQTFEGANTLLISVKWNDADMVAKIANNLADTFIEKYQIFNTSQAREKRIFIEDQMNLIRIKLDEAQKNLNNFQEKEGVMQANDMINEITKRISNWEARKYQVGIDSMVLQSKFNQIKEQISQIKGDVNSDTDISNDYKNFLKSNTPLLQMQGNISVLEEEVNSLTYRYTDEYPLLSAKKKELETKKKDLEDEKTKFQDEVNRINLENKVKPKEFNNPFLLELIKTEMEINAKKNEEKLLQDLIIKEQKKIKSLPEKQSMYADVLREKMVNEEYYTILLKRLSEARIEENVNTNDVRVFDRAYKPYQPLKPRPLMNTIMGAIIGLVLGIGVSMTIEYFDDSFHSVAEVEQFLKLPVLAAIPKLEGIKGKK